MINRLVFFFTTSHIFSNIAIWKHVPEKNIYVLTEFEWIIAVYHFYITISAFNYSLFVAMESFSENEAYLYFHACEDKVWNHS